LPFVPTPMGKGVISDEHPLCVAAARSRALSQADVIFLFGARLNWILHFGRPPRFRADVKIVQIDLHAEELENNVPAEVSLLGSLECVTEQLNASVKRTFGESPANLCGASSWRRELREKVEGNKTRNEVSVTKWFSWKNGAQENLREGFRLSVRVFPRMCCQFQW